MAQQLPLDERALFRFVAENAGDFAVYVKDLGGRALSWNPGVGRLLGYSEEEWVGRHASIIFTPEDLARGEPEREMEVALREGRSEDRRWHVRKDGSRFYANVLLVPLRDEAGEPRAFARVLRDDTARRAAEDALSASEARLRHLIHNIPGGSINVLDRDLRYLFAGGRGLGEVGLSSETLVGKTLSELYTAEAVEYVMPFYRRALAGEFVDFELAVGDQWYIINAAPLNGDAGGMPTSIIVLAQNITARKVLAEELRYARDELERRVFKRTEELQRMTETLLSEVKERKAAEERARGLLRRLIRAQEDERRRLSRELHDRLGQRLTALRLRLELARRAAGPAAANACDLEELQQMVALLDAEADALTHEVRPAELEVVGLAGALEGFVSEWSRHTGTAAEFQSVAYAAGSLTREAETTLYRVAQEALNNAAKHSGASRVAVILEGSEGRVSLVVEDDGRGFDPEAEHAGSLGLGGMRERVALARGTLELESAPGAGTTLFVRLPAVAAGHHDGELYRLQKAAHDLGALYYAAELAYHEGLPSGQWGGLLDELTEECLRAGAEYVGGLDKLVAALEKEKPGVGGQKQLAHYRRLREAHERQLKLIAHTRELAHRPPRHEGETEHGVE